MKLTNWAVEDWLRDAMSNSADLASTPLAPIKANVGTQTESFHVLRIEIDRADILMRAGIAEIADLRKSLEDARAAASMAALRADATEAECKQADADLAAAKAEHETKVRAMAWDYAQQVRANDALKAAVEKAEAERDAARDDLLRVASKVGVTYLADYTNEVAGPVSAIIGAIVAMQTRESDGVKVFDQLLAEERAVVATLRQSVANAEAVATKATLRAEKAEGELACERTARANDNIQIGRLWDSVKPYLDATTNGKTWAEIIKIYAEREKAAIVECDAARAELAAMREKPVAEPESDPKVVAALALEAVKRDITLRWRESNPSPSMPAIYCDNNGHGSRINYDEMHRLLDLRIVQAREGHWFWPYSSAKKLAEQLKPVAEPKPERSDWRERFGTIVKNRLTKESGFADASVFAHVNTDLRDLRDAVLALRDGIDEMQGRQS